MTGIFAATLQISIIPKPNPSQPITGKPKGIKQQQRIYHIFHI